MRVWDILSLMYYWTRDDRLIKSKAKKGEIIRLMSLVVFTSSLCVDEIQKCGHSNESYLAVLPWSAVYYAVQNRQFYIPVCLHEILNCDPHWNRNTIEHVLSGPVLFGVFQTKIFETCFRFVLVALFGNILRAVVSQRIPLKSLKYLFALHPALYWCSCTVKASRYFL